MMPVELDADALAYRQQQIAFWNAMASSPLDSSPRRLYHQRLHRVYGHLVTPGSRVLELGCGQGNLLASLSPSVGVGVDFSPAMLALARQRHPKLSFIEADAHDCPAEGPFDTIILSDLIGEVWDIQRILETTARLCQRETQVIINFHSRLWEWPLRLAHHMDLAMPSSQRNWLTWDDATNLLRLSGLQLVRSWQEMLWPLPTWGIEPLANRLLVKLPGLRHLGLSNFCVVRLAPKAEPETPRSVSVLVPARNEAGNMPAIFARLPKFKGHTQLIVVEGHSSDDTYAAAEKEKERHPEIDCLLLRQPGKGKGDAVRTGFGAATGDILMILDADLTVAPEDLPRFYDAIVQGQGDFINGVRLVYPMEQGAMRPVNLLGNRFFSRAFTYLLGQSVKDTLCGTKVLWREDYLKIQANRAYFGDFDPFGDFDLLFGAARLNLKIIDMPIRYRQRTYGTTNIRRWRHGLLLLQMIPFGLRRLKFI